jgi:non-specific serine/threonine protein kinase/serine/threonine-protein kinase
MTLDAEHALFDACLDADAAERERLLAAADPALRARVERLLAAHDRESSTIAPGFMELSPLATPRVIGHFRILERIGEGAMGEVYLAEQQQPVRRRVALKVLKFGLSTREVISRFELERQALAMLAHANIARIFDAGATGDGRPYFAMEYVSGISITRYCDEHKLPLAERLAIFAQACAGVQHAHLRGIIHRDLKPSNILVTEVDGKPAPKIIDFGIAKATTIVAEEGDAHTRMGHVLGTPEYMSPEQAQLSPLEIDARTDVYSLGIVLYELLTGARPYSVTRDLVMPEALAREIAEAEPVLPSARAAESTEEGAARAAQRGQTPRALAGKLRGDLDWIVLRAIEKDRDRRYSSAQELEAELERHGRNEAVLASPPSVSYRVGKFVRRHRLGVATTAGLFAAAIVFGSAMALLARETARERDRANEEAAIAKRVTDFTAGLFEMANPASSGSSTVSARQLLDAGVRRLEAQMSSEQPQTRAALLESAGNAYRDIGDFGEANRLIREAEALRKEHAADEPVAYAKVLMSESWLLRDQGNYEGAESLARESVAVLESAGKASGSKPGAADLDELYGARVELAEALRRQSKLDEAATVVNKVIDVVNRGEGISTANQASALYELGRIREGQGELPEAVQLLTRALDIQVKADGEFAEPTINARNGLADALVVQGKSAEAEKLLQQNVDGLRKIYGDVHAIVGIAYNNLANALSDLPERYTDAEKDYLKALDILSQTYGIAHPEVANTYHNLAGLYLKMKEWQKAADAGKQALDLRMATIGPEHPNTASSRMILAMALSKLQRYTEAEALAREARASFVAALGAEHWRAANASYNLGTILQTEGKLQEAEQEVRPALELLTKTLGPDHPRTQAAQQTLKELEKSLGSGVKGAGG